MRVSISVPDQLWDQAVMISGEHSASTLIQKALRFYVQQNMTKEMKMKLIEQFAKTLGVEK